VAKHKRNTMPSLTVEGRRDIIKQAIIVMGKPAFEKWLLQHNLTSIKIALDSVRKLRPSFFRELYQLCCD